MLQVLLVLVILVSLALRVVPFFKEPSVGEKRCFSPFRTCSHVFASTYLFVCVCVSVCVCVCVCVSNNGKSRENPPNVTTSIQSM